MNVSRGSYTFLMIVLGILFLVSFYFQDFLLEQLWIFYLFPLFIFGGGFVGLFIVEVNNKNKVGVLCGCLMLLPIMTVLLINSEVFKSKKVLEATLTDDLSAIYLTLRENQQFEVTASTLFTEEHFQGSYQINGSKIIFMNKRYVNDLIPDTVTIVGDKIFLKYDKEGNPVTEFASYFDVKNNNIKRSITTE